MGGDFGEKVGLGRDGPELDPPWEYKPSYGPEFELCLQGRLCI